MIRNQEIEGTFIPGPYFLDEWGYLSLFQIVLQ